MSTKPNNISTAQNPVGRFMVAVGGIIEQKTTGNILVIQRAANLDWHPNEWEIDYGRIDQFEDPEAGLRRELFEEVGLKNFKIGQVLRVWHIYRGAKAAENDLIGITYHCTTDETDIKLSEEHQAFKWVTPEEGLSLIKVDGIQEDVKRFIAMKKNVT